MVPLHSQNNSEIYREALGTIMCGMLRNLGGLMAGRESDPLTLRYAVKTHSREKGTDVAEKVTARECEMCRAYLRKPDGESEAAVWDSISGWFGFGVTAVEEER
jgi:hypothetical protein